MEPDEVDGVRPDGLTCEDIDRLLSEVAVFWSLPSRATSGLVDGSAAERRDRRMARRRLGAVVRALPVRSAQVDRGGMSGEVA